MFRLQTGEAETPRPAFFDYLVLLDGSTYRLAYAWNDRSESWYLSVFDADDAPLVRGVRISLDYPLIGRNNDSRLPPGSISAMTLDRSNRADPNFDDLGTRVSMVYVPEDELTTNL